MIGVILARRYAKAIIGLAQEEGKVAEVGEDLGSVAEVFAKSPELVNAFSDPTVAPQAKKRILDAILEKGGIQELTRRFIHLILEKNRLLGIGEIAEAYQTLGDQLENRVRARVVSATALKEGEEKKIRDVLSKLSGKEVVLKVEVDESLLGGVVAYVGSLVYDGSLRNQLQQIKDSLNRGR